MDDSYFVVAVWGKVVNKDKQLVHSALILVSNNISISSTMEINGNCKSWYDVIENKYFQIYDMAYVLILMLVLI